MRALAMRATGIDTFGVLLDPTAVGSGGEIFGRVQTVPVRDLSELPARLEHDPFDHALLD